MFLKSVSIYAHYKWKLTSHNYCIATFRMEVKMKAVVLNVSALVLKDITSIMRFIHGRKYILRSNHVKGTPDLEHHSYALNKQALGQQASSFEIRKLIII